MLNLWALVMALLIGALVLKAWDKAPANPLAGIDSGKGLSMLVEAEQEAWSKVVDTIEAQVHWSAEAWADRPVAQVQHTEEPQALGTTTESKEDNTKEADR